MNLFENINQLKEMNNRIVLFAKDNGFNLLCKEQHWHLFQKDERIVQIKFIKKNNKNQIELKSPLFEGLLQSHEIFLRPIYYEKCIRNIIKTDSINQYEDKLYLIRHLNETKTLYKDKTIIYNINSMLRRAKILQEEISRILEYIMFAKLN